MGIANFPGNLAIAIQQGYLQRRFEKGLFAELGYRAVASKEIFVNGIGETVTKTRPGLLQAVTTPLNPSQITNLDDGLTPQTWSVEQYTMALNEYADTLDLNIIANKVGIADQFLKNSQNLGENARRSRDLLVLATILNSYMGGNTRVTTTLGSPNTTISVDDIRGFQYAIPLTGANAGKPNIPVSNSNTMPVQVGSDIYTLVGATADGTNVSTVASMGGISGTLTFSGNVTVLDGTAPNAVISAFAPQVVRPNGRATTAAVQSADYLTLDVIRDAVEALQSNNVPAYEDGNYMLILSPRSFKQLYRDPEFQILFRGTEFKSQAYRNFWQSTALGVNIVRTNMAPQQVLNGLSIQRPFIFGQESIIESDFQGMDEILNSKYGDDLHEIVRADDVFQIVRKPLDRIKHMIAQSWWFASGYVAPTDQTANPSTIPTASNAYYKRAVMIETSGV